MMCSGSVYFQFVQIPHKETPFLSCTIRVQSGRNRNLPRCHAGNENRASPAETGRRGPFKKHCPLLMRGNSQGSGQTTNHLLTAANVWEFSYTASAAFSSFPRRWLFLFVYGLNLSVSLRSPAPLVGEPLAGRRAFEGVRFATFGPADIGFCPAAEDDFGAVGDDSEK